MRLTAQVARVRMDAKTQIYALNNTEILMVIFAQFIAHKYARTTKYFVQEQGVQLMDVMDQINAKTKEPISGAKHQAFHAQVGAQEYALIMKSYVTARSTLVMVVLQKKFAERQSRIIMVSFAQERNLPYITRMKISEKIIRDAVDICQHLIIAPSGAEKILVRLVVPFMKMNLVVSQKAIAWRVTKQLMVKIGVQARLSVRNNAQIKRNFVSTRTKMIKAVRRKIYVLTQTSSVKPSLLRIHLFMIFYLNDIQYPSK